MDQISLSPDHCSSCSEKLPTDTPLSKRQQVERQLLDEAVSIVDGYPQVSFPLTSNPRILLDNEDEMKRRAESQWRSLKKKGSNFLEAYNGQIKDFEDRGVLTRVL